MFLTFEGIEGTGKSTQIRLLVDYLERRGQPCLVTMEPGGSRVGRELRRMLLHLESRDITPETELFLYLADRAQHVAQVIRPALAEGKVVISDRFADSTVVYQGYGRGLEPRLLHQLNEVAVAGCWPDATLLMDLEPEVGLNRAMARNLREGKAVEEGRFEAESLEFHHRVREGYLTWAALHQNRIRIVDAHPGPDEVFSSVRTIVDQLLTRRR
ncbi:MAG: dTMP kinase [Desulfovibrionaceae bacterium]